jgi:hypothetical protein
MADGNMSEDAAGQAISHAPSPALRSEMSWSTPDRIMVRGFDLGGDLLGKVDLGDMAFLELMGRLPTQGESTVFNTRTGHHERTADPSPWLCTRLGYALLDHLLDGARAHPTANLREKDMGIVQMLVAVQVAVTGHL